jgi:glycosyltransferase involved in cell wall biosynthesis
LIIFISIPWFLPAYKAGGPIQSIDNLVNNYTENIEYKIFCGNTDLNNEPLQNIEEDKWIQYNAHTQVWYTSNNNASKNIQTQVKLIQPDVIFIIGIFSWQYNIVPLLFCKAKKKILSVRGMLHTGALSQKKVKKRMFLNLLNVFNIKGHTSFHATDISEAAFIKNEFGPNAKIYVAGNFAKSILHKHLLHKEPNFLKLITIALISPMKNHLLILQALQNCTANMEYNIYGPIKDTDYWELCKIQIGLLPLNIKVQYHGEIKPTEIENVLAQNHVFIMPSKSENFGHALVESLSAGKPIITSHATPWNNLLDNKAGINCNEDLHTICNAINLFAGMNAETYEQFANGALQYATNKNNKEALYIQYQQMFTV